MAHPKKEDEEKYQKMGASLDPATYQRVIHYCEVEERSFSWVARKALNEWLDKHDTTTSSN